MELRLLVFRHAGGSPAACRERPRRFPGGSRIAGGVRRAADLAGPHRAVAR